MSEGTLCIKATFVGGKTMLEEFLASLESITEEELTAEIKQAQENSKDSCLIDDES